MKKFIEVTSAPDMEKHLINIANIALVDPLVSSVLPGNCRIHLRDVYGAINVVETYEQVKALISSQE